MRLSKKGCVHLNEWMVHKLPVDAYEFKPEDFTGAVVLTIKEAEQIKALICKLQSLNPNAANADDWFAYWTMNDRIKQAESNK